MGLFLTQQGCDRVAAGRKSTVVRVADPTRACTYCLAMEPSGSRSRSSVLILPVIPA
jgi:hypothetical protein